MDAIKAYVRECVNLRKDPEDLSYVLHRVIPLPDPRIVSMFVNAFKEERDMLTHLELLKHLLLKARPLGLDELIDLKGAVRPHVAKFEVASTILDLINEQVTFKSPVLSRWHAMPCENMLEWLSWDSFDIAYALTEPLCEPFRRLRAWEFRATPPGPHLQRLNDLATSMSYFCSSSVLVATTMARKQGIQAVSKWLEIMQHLLDLGNYHILFSLYSGLVKHQVDRLSWLWSSLSRRQSKFKANLDELFDPKCRMERMVKTWTERAGSEPTVMCIFWLLQKATLLEESPLILDGCINPEQLRAAANVFRTLSKMQAVWYPKKPIPEELLWYFLQIPRGMQDRMEHLDDQLYLLSDKAKLAKSSSNPQLLPRKASVEEAVASISSDELENDGSAKTRSMSRGPSAARLGVTAVFPRKMSLSTDDNKLSDL